MPIDVEAFPTDNQTAKFALKPSKRGFAFSAFNRFCKISSYLSYFPSSWININERINASHSQRYPQTMNVTSTGQNVFRFFLILFATSFPRGKKNCLPLLYPNLIALASSAVPRRRCPFIPSCLVIYQQWYFCPIALMLNLSSQRQFVMVINVITELNIVQKEESGIPWPRFSSFFAGRKCRINYSHCSFVNPSYLPVILTTSLWTFWRFNSFFMLVG